MRGAFSGQIQPRRHQRQRTRLRKPGFLGAYGRGESQIAARGIRTQSHFARRITLLQRPLIHSERIIVGGRGRIFRSQTVVWHQYGAPPLRAAKFGKR